MLKLRRLKFHADDIQDVMLTFRKLGERPDDYALKSVYTSDLYIPFTKNARGVELANMFDKGIKIISENGKLKKLVEKYGLINSIVEEDYRRN